MLEKYLATISLLSVLEIGCQSETVVHPRVKNICTYCITDKSCLPNVEYCSSVYVKDKRYKNVCVRKDEQVDEWVCGTSKNTGW